MSSQPPSGAPPRKQVTVQWHEQAGHQVCWGDCPGCGFRNATYELGTFRCHCGTDCDLVEPKPKE
jgi:hypothetical protein